MHLQTSLIIYLLCSFDANKFEWLYGFEDMQGHTSKGEVDGEGPAWAPLRDNYMLTNSKLKDWDKIPVRTLFIYTMLNVTLVEGSSSPCLYHHPSNPIVSSFFCMQETAATDDFGRMSEDSSSDGD